MIQFSLSSFASQFKANYGSKRGSSQDQAPEISRDQDQQLEQTPSPDQVDHVDPQEWEEGELASEEDEAVTSSDRKKGKTTLWKVSQEKTKFYSQAQQANHQSGSTYSSQSQLQAKTQNTILTRNEAGSQPPQLAQA